MKPRPATNQKALLAVAACLVAGVLLFLRARQTVEYRVWFGSAEEQVEVCRTIPLIRPKRQGWTLPALLSAPHPDVRSAAITAVSKGAGCANDRRLVFAQLRDDENPASLRQKAGLFLLADGFRPALQYLSDPVRDKEFRSELPGVSAEFLCRNLDTMNADELRALFELALSKSEPARVDIRGRLKPHFAEFAPIRTRLVEWLGQTREHADRVFILAALTAIDGTVRGASHDDWIMETIQEQDTRRGHVVEAEWAVDIQPNYDIREFKATRCIALGEGAGGILSWLKASKGTVDVGSACLSLYAAEDGPHRVWARVYMDDKCGNSFGFTLNERRYTNFNDHKNTLGEWHWLQLRSKDAADGFEFEEGFQPIRIEAWEDAVFLDKFALTVPGVHPRELTPTELWDPSMLGGISFAPEYQTQPRGTDQTVVVWVRRNAPSVRSGSVRIDVPDAFSVVSPNPTHIAFADGNPLARTSFVVRLPAEATAGEGVLRAFYTEDGDTEANMRMYGEIILGAHYDWFTTGPLSPADPLCDELLDVTEPIPESKLLDNWSRPPVEGYDTYRRFNPELAWGQLRNKHIFFATNLHIAESGTYTTFLTVDDTATCLLGGTVIAEQRGRGPGEGRMTTREVRLEEGAHQLFVKMHQADFPDPEGNSARRRTYNNCSLKLLIRKSRHQPAQAVQGIPFERAVP